MPAAVVRVDQIAEGPDLAAFDDAVEGSLARLPAADQTGAILVPAFTVSQLQARTNRKFSVYLSEAYRQGTFHFDPSNLAAAVASDPGMAFLIPPASDPTGASGAWVRANTQARVANLGWFGLIANDNTANEAAINAAFSWLNQNDGSTLDVPPGTWRYSTDKRILKSGCTLRGSNSRCNLQPNGVGQARIIVGQSDETTIGTNGRIEKNGIKPIETTFKWINFQSVGARDGEIVLIDLADNTKFEDCYIGHTSGSSTTACIGVKTHWAQWTYFTRCTFNCNWVNVFIRLQATNTENEDHFHFDKCQMYCGKSGPTTVNMPGPNGVVVPGATPVTMMPCAILIHKEAGNKYSIFELSITGCHIGTFGTTGEMSGIATRSDNVGDTRAVHTAQISGNFFEYVHYPIDTVRYNVAYATGGTDTSRYATSGNSFLQNKICFNGSSVSKNKVTSTGNYFLQGDSVCVGFTVQFTGYNSVEAMTDAFPNGLMRCRFSDKWNKEACLNNVLAAEGSIVVPAGSTYIDVTHGLFAAPSAASLKFNNLHGNSWLSTYAVNNVGATTFRVHFGTPPSVDRTLQWSGEVPYI